MFQELARHTLLNGIIGAVNMIGRTCNIFDREINNHALPITITKSREVRSPIQFLLMPHHRCGNATQVSLWSANLIGGSWRPWKRNLTTPTNLYVEPTISYWKGDSFSNHCSFFTLCSSRAAARLVLPHRRCCVSIRSCGLWTCVRRSGSNLVSWQHFSWFVEWRH